MMATTNSQAPGGGKAAINLPGSAGVPPASAPPHMPPRHRRSQAQLGRAKAGEEAGFCVELAGGARRLRRFTVRNPRSIHSPWNFRAMKRRKRRTPAALCFLLPILLFQTGWAAPESLAAHVERTFFEAQARFNRNSNDAEAAWQFGLACFDWADLANTNARRADIAEQGIAASRQAIQLAPEAAAGHYYLGLNLGQLARTKKLGALKLVSEMEAEFLAAIEADEKFDFAGAHRSLGLLYLDAPGWPTSIGNRTKARLHLRKAVELSPDYPDNPLSLIEAYLKWGEKSAAASQVAPTEEVLERARKTLTGDKWQASWQDWDHRWAKLKAKALEPAPHLESPRQRK